MAQVVSNLLTNAAKYSEPGSHILVRGGRVGDIVRIAVRDEGIGLDRAMRDSVFEPFVQQPQSLERAAGGLGLGLAIVRNIVSAHGGTVRVESDGIGRGAEFIVELPAVDVPSQPALRTEPAPTDTRGPQQRILVVDDNRDTAEMLRTALEQLGHVVEIAFDGPSALARVEVFQPSTVLLDIGLPVMDGYEVARRLKASHTCPGSDPAARTHRLRAGRRPASRTRGGVRASSRQADRSGRAAEDSRRRHSEGVLGF